MLSVKFNNCYTSCSSHKYNNKLGNINNKLHSDSISFRGKVDFIMPNRIAPVISKGIEFDHISNVLKTLGVKELEIGDNITLAKLLKSAMYRVKMLGFDIPTRISCESKFFKENEEFKIILKEYMGRNKFVRKFTVPGVTSWDNLSEPILLLNTEHNWNIMDATNTKSKDLRHAIWHETGHCLHMKNYKKDPHLFEAIGKIKLDPYQKDIIRESIGDYAADNSIIDTIAETFARFMSGQSYNELHPEIFNIYAKYGGPMPKFR